SRRARPKQLLRLVSDKTLLEETLARLEGLVPNERILVLTNAEQESAVRKLLGNFPKENIIAEPAKRDTAAAVALGTGWVVARDHAATMLILSAGTQVCSSGRCPRCSANSTVRLQGWRISFHNYELRKILRKRCVNASANCHGSPLITRSWKRRTASLWWKPVSTGTTSEAGER